MFCPKCGRQTRPDDTFCAVCGHRLPTGEASAETAPQPTAYGPPPGYEHHPVTARKTRECVWFIANIVGAGVAALSLPFSLIGAILYGLGIYYGNRARTARDDEEYAGASRVSMIMFWVGLGLAVVLPIAAIAGLATYAFTSQPFHSPVWPPFS